MKPFIFSIGSTPVPAFFFFIVTGALTAIFYMVWIGKKSGLNPERILDMGIIGMISGVLGTRIFHILVEAPLYYWEKPARVFEFARGGFVSWGAFLAIPLTFLLYFRWKKIPTWRYLDILAVASPIIKFFIRLACLMAGCCYGKPTSLPWAITFTNPDSTAHYFMGAIPLHPVQIYSMIHAVLLFIFINWFYWRSRKANAGRSPSGVSDASQGKPDGGGGGRAVSPTGFNGQTTCLLAIGWALPRALIEFLRADSDRGIYFGLISTGQVMGILTIILFTLLYRHLSKKYAA